MRTHTIQPFNWQGRLTAIFADKKALVPSQDEPIRKYAVYKYVRELDTDQVACKKVGFNLSKSEAYIFVAASKSKSVMVNGQMVFSRWFEVKENLK